VTASRSGSHISLDRRTGRLRDIELPQEYAKGLESLLLKEQENDRMGVETEIHQKQVQVAEAVAEATKVQELKQAEGQAAVKIAADAEQHDRGTGGGPSLHRRTES
jgi:regulator of protease activity HflC (stomatin/prohibitin superfamily)